MIDNPRTTILDLAKREVGPLAAITDGVVTPDELIPLRWALYGPNAPLSGMRRREVRDLIGPIIKRKSRHSRFRYEYIRATDLADYIGTGPGRPV